MYRMVQLSVRIRYIYLSEKKKNTRGRRLESLDDDVYLPETPCPGPCLPGARDLQGPHYQRHAHAEHAEPRFIIPQILGSWSTSSIQIPSISNQLLPQPRLRHSLLQEPERIIAFRRNIKSLGYTNSTSIPRAQCQPNTLPPRLQSTKMRPMACGSSSTRVCTTSQVRTQLPTHRLPYMSGSSALADMRPQNSSTSTQAGPRS